MVELWLRVVHGALGSLLLSCIFVCSCTVIFVVVFNKKLHHPSMVMSLGLVVADLVLAATWIIQIMVYSIAGEWPLGDGGCIPFGMILVWMLYVRWCEVGVVTLDRFLTIVFPFYKYKKHHKRVLFALTILAWSVPGLLVTPSAFGFGKQTFRPQVSACTVDCKGDKGCIGYYSALVIIFKGIGGDLPLTLYITMYCIGLRKRRKYEARRKLGTISRNNSSSLIDLNQNQDRRQNQVRRNSDLRTSVINLATISEESESAQTSNTIRQTASDNFPSRRERNALATVFMIFISMILTHIPVYSTSILEHLGNLYSSIPLVVHLIAVYIFLLGLFLDSLVIMRNTDVHEVLVQIARKWMATQRNTNLTRKGSTTLSELGSRRSLNHDNII